MIGPHFRNVLEVDLRRLQRAGTDDPFIDIHGEPSTLVTSFKLDVTPNPDPQFGPDAVVHIPPESAESFLLTLAHTADQEHEGALVFCHTLPFPPLTLQHRICLSAIYLKSAPSWRRVDG